MKEQIKNQIIEKGILSENDFETAPDWALDFAEMILKISDNEVFCSSCVSNFEIEKFLEEIQTIQDTLDLENCDRVTNNFEEKTKTVKIGIPNKIVPFLRTFNEQMKID
jgi:hypothetical protein